MTPILTPPVEIERPQRYPALKCVCTTCGVIRRVGKPERDSGAECRVCGGPMEIFSRTNESDIIPKLEMTTLLCPGCGVRFDGPVSMALHVHLSHECLLAQVALNELSWITPHDLVLVKTVRIVQSKARWHVRATYPNGADEMVAPFASRQVAVRYIYQRLPAPMLHMALLQREYTDLTSLFFE